MTAFSFDEFDPAIVGVFNLDHISATVPNDTDTSDLVATSTTTGASVKVNGVEQVSGETANDFTGSALAKVAFEPSSAITLPSRASRSTGPVAVALRDGDVRGDSPRAGPRPRYPPPCP